MKKRALCILCALALMLTAGCGSKPAQSDNSQESDARLTVLATTYPVYLFASTLTEGVEGVEVQRLNTGNISCLHDYTLSVDDMKMIEGADLIAINGVGLETFMEDALAAAKSTVVDCSEGVELLENLAHHHEEGDEHEHDHGHYDPHIWLDPENAAVMVENLADALAEADPDNKAVYEQNAEAAEDKLEARKDELENQIEQAGLENAGLITFHDGFQYFSKAFDLHLMASIEEEAGSEASAKEINDISAMVNDNNIPVIFTETNGSDATAQAISRETGCQVGELTMLMSGDGETLDDYLDGVSSNITAIISGYGEEASLSAN